MSGRRFLYAIPAGVSAATALLAVLCLLRGLEAIEQPFPGFFYYVNGTLSSMQRGGWEGQGAGLLPGCRVIAVDGQRVADGHELRRALSRHAVGEKVRLQVLMRDGREERTVTLRLRRFTKADILATFVVPYSIGVAFLLIGTFIFFLRRGYEAALALSICTVAAVFYLTTFDAHTAHHYARLWVSYPLLGAVSLHLFSAFPAIRPRFHRAPLLAFFYAIAAAILTYTQVTLLQVVRGKVPTVFSSVYLTGCFVANILLLTITARRDPSEAIRNKAKTIRIGLLVAVAAGVVWSLVVRIFPEQFTAERVMALSGLFPLLLAYATIKKNLFDVDFVLRTTAIYAVATTVVLGLYFGAVYIIGLAVSGWTQRSLGFHASIEAAVVSTIVAALLFHPLRSFVQRVVDRFFFRGKAELQSRLEQMGKDLASMTVDLPALGSRLTSQVQQLMRCRYVALLARGATPGSLPLRAAAGPPPAPLEAAAISPESPLSQLLAESAEPFTVGRPEEGDSESQHPALADLRQAEVGVVVPLRAGPVLAGVLLLGVRPLVDPYGRFDLLALRALAVPAGLALEHALVLREHAERERLAALGKLSAVIIHEIKNPLGIIRVSSGTLKKRFDPSDSGHELASFIEEEVIRMNQTIGQFLRFARPSQPNISRFNLADLVRRTAESSRPELEQAGIQIACEVPTELFAQGDPDHTQHVLLNLIINARQALEGRPSPRVSLGLRFFGPFAELTVSDNGPGIDPSVRGRIFEPFFTTRPGGTGLGLAITRQLVQDQGGRISVRTGDQGTEFKVLLPAA